jgi:hypothetical protein
MRFKPVTPRFAATALLALGAASSLMAEFPGTLTYDSLIQLIEGRAASYSFWHPAVMSWLLGLSDQIVPGAGVYMVVQTLLGFGALASLVWLPRRVSWAAVVVAALFLALPQIFMFQGIVWKDVLFADATLAAFVCLAHAAAHWRLRRRRFVLLGLAAIFLALATLTRQNGAILLPVAALTLAVVVARLEASWRKGAVFAVALLAAAGSIAIAANVGLSLRHDGSSPVEDQIKVLRLYDIAGMVKRNPEIRLIVLENEAPQFARLIRSDAVPLFTPERNDALGKSAPLIEALEETPAAALGRQWRETVLQRPGTWLAVRTEIFAWTFLQLHVRQCWPIAIGVGNEPYFLSALHMRARLDARDIALNRYANAFVGTPMYSHAFYALMALAALWLLVRRRRPEDIAMAGLLGGALAFALSFFVISIACDYRYLYVLDLSAIAALLYWSADPSLAADQGPHPSTGSG